jgi:hypothetical protein
MDTSGSASSAQARGIMRARAGKDAAQGACAMTRFDRIWEPLLVCVAAAMVLIGTF